MSVIIETLNPTFHSLTGTQPVGTTQVAVRGDYAGTITMVKRTNVETWTVVTRSAKGAFTDRAEWGASASIWFDRAEGRYVVDHAPHHGYPGFGAVEVDRTRSLGAAIGVATSYTARQWAATR